MTALFKILITLYLGEQYMGALGTLHFHMSLKFFIIKRFSQSGIIILNEHLMSYQDSDS